MISDQENLYEQISKCGDEIADAQERIKAKKGVVVATEKLKNAQESQNGLTQLVAGVQSQERVFALSEPSDFRPSDFTVVGHPKVHL